MKHHTRMCLSNKRSQEGFLLVQLAIAVLIISALMAYVGLQYWQKSVREIGDDQARLVGSVMRSIDDAAKTYATTFFTQIQRGQAVTRGGYTVPAVRVMAPTPADLRDLGMLAPRSATPVVFAGRSISFNITYTVDQTGCVVPTCNIRSQVTSTAPMLLQTGAVDVRRATLAATAASPGNAGVALPTAMGGDPSTFVAANGSQVGSNPGRIEGLIAMANGYDSSGFFEFDRRDGSLPRTGDINMQDPMGDKHNIRSANAIESVTMKTSGRLTTGEYLELAGVAVKAGDPCEKEGLIARDDKGLILSCQSGGTPPELKWRSL